VSPKIEPVKCEAKSMTKSIKRKTCTSEQKTVMNNIFNNLILDVDLPEEFDESMMDRYSCEGYVPFVDKVNFTHGDISTTWYCFTDEGFTKPMSKRLPTIKKKQSEDSYFIFNRHDEHDTIVAVNSDFLKEHFDEVMSMSVFEYGDDQDVVDFVKTYTNNNTDIVKDIFDKDTVSLVNLYTYFQSLRTNDDVLYLTDCDIFTNGKLGTSTVEVDVVLPFAQSPYLLLTVPCNVEKDGKLNRAKVHTAIPLKERYNVSTLPFKPVNDSDIQERINTNRSYISSSERYVKYVGEAQEAGLMAPRDIFVNGRVIVDSQALYYNDVELFNNLYAIHGIDVICNSNNQSKNFRSVTEANGDYSDDDLLCLVNTILCYDLNRKKWFVGDKNNIEKIEFRKDSFEKLQMDNTKKNIIRKICSSSVSHNQNSIDFIDSKGGGNVFLLHGEPGTGKTLTAEAISELLERPLYKINISEFDSLKELEHGMELSLRYAERWNATLLVDEADVALEKRDSTNIERNAIVAVFLRLIEYYSGTMFLTSNRANEFDEAFKSRITFAIHYTKPVSKVKFKIWKNLLDNVSHNITDDDIETLSEYNINGRQIKNIITTASFMSDDGSVMYDDVYTVLEQTVQFDNFMAGQ